MAGPMVSVQGGALLLEGNTVELAADAAARPGVVLATGDDATALAVRGNVLRDAGTAGTPLVRNWTGQDAVESGNTVPAGSDVVTDSGMLWHRVRATAADVRETLRALYGDARHLAAGLLRRFR